MSFWKTEYITFLSRELNTFINKRFLFHLDFPVTNFILSKNETKKAEPLSMEWKQR